MSKANKWYLKKGQFEKYEINPFIDKAIKNIQENKVLKKQYFNGNRGVQQIISSAETGEVIGQSVFAKVVEVDEEKFAKLYLNELSILWDMKTPALKLFSYILTVLQPNQDQFYFSVNKAMDYTGYKTVTAINNAIAQLLSAGLIAKTIEDNWYFINPLVVFNGNRVTFAKTYVKKKKEFNNPNQLNLLDSLDDK